MNINNPIKNVDPILASIIHKEEQRQEEQISLIASENYASDAVMQATGSVLTNKYAEGYPGKRYYAGCTYVDEAETVAIERCKKLFGADHANVQPHAGSPANMAVYFACLKPGDTILGMSLREGGHLTHGHSVNFSGRLFNAVPYYVNKETEMLDYDELASLAQQHKPKLIIVGASAYSRTIDYERCASIARENGSLLLADIAHVAGLIAADLHPSPIPHADFVTSTTHKTLRGPRGGIIMCKKEYAELIDKTIMPGLQGGPFMNSIAAKAVAFHEAAQPDFVAYQKQVIANAQTMADAFQQLGYRIVSGGTDNHLFVIDLRSKKITGLAADKALEETGIIVSRSCIPFDPEKPWITSGIRIGTPAMTTRGMKTEEALQLVDCIDEVINNHHDRSTLMHIKKQIATLAHNHPVYHR